MMLRYFIGKHKTKTVQMYVDVRYRKSLVKRFTRERKLKEQVERVCVCVLRVNLMQTLFASAAHQQPQ